MENKLIDLVKETLLDSNKLNILEDICELCETFRSNKNLDEMVKSLHEWFYQKYNIEKFSFAIHDSDKDLKSILFSKGESFTLNDPFAFYFIINTNTEQNGIVTLCANDKNDYDKITKNYQYLETLFFQITPVIENAILRKLYLEHSSIDSVTNVYNREYLLEYIHKKILLSHDSEDSIVFMMVGVDRFKAVIDEFNYDVGDQVLIALAKVIHARIKSHDIVARLVGDEFLIALPNRVNIESVRQKAQNIIEDFAKVQIEVSPTSNHTLKKTICIGVARFPQDGSSIDDVIKHADSALYEAKNSGRGVFKCFSEIQKGEIELF
jgi:two-component system cell cycle response regulator